MGNHYQVAVIGGGHAGIEAAVASAQLGAKTVLFTLSLDAIGNLPCNPSIGGTAKGHLVREIDALGGIMGLAADATFLQSRMLNRGKGPAVHSLRVQTDRSAYHSYTKKLLEGTAGLDIRQAEITHIVVCNGSVVSVHTRMGEHITVDSLILATGTYLGGKIFTGQNSFLSGPDGVSASISLVESLKAAGVPLRRFKTGTPARVHRRSIDFSKLVLQEGDTDIQPFSFMTKGPLYNQVVCHIAHTNKETHRVINDNLHRSPLFSGEIEGIGPRYCPSIEDKVVRFAEKDSHQIFVEPCGMDTEEMYLQGMSSSLPVDVQEKMYRTIAGFENLEIMRPAYAIEYDCVDPLALKPSLEFKEIKGLFGAGQFNGTSGYEEAAAQGLIAGINAARMVAGLPCVLMKRQDSYIGTLIDDLVTKGVSDPYRMMTSRSEFRLYLRQDNADERLTPLGREIGLVDEERWEHFQMMQKMKESELSRLSAVRIQPRQADKLMKTRDMPPLKNAVSALEFLRRPEIEYADLMNIIGNGTIRDPVLLLRIQTEIKYEGYIKRQLAQIESMKKLESRRIPENIDFSSLSGMRLEAREKLGRIRPQTLGQASRVPGVTPNDISQLSLAIAMANVEKKS